MEGRASRSSGKDPCPAGEKPVLNTAISCILGNVLPEVFTMRAIFFAIALALCVAQLSLAQVDPRWKPNDPDRPVPAVIVPGTASTQDSPGRPPSDSIVLFDGKDLSQWTTDDGQPAKWKVADGVMEVVPHSGLIHTRQPLATVNCMWSSPNRCRRLAKVRSAVTVACS